MEPRPGLDNVYIRFRLDRGKFNNKPLRSLHGAGQARLILLVQDFLTSRGLVRAVARSCGLIRYDTFLP